MLVGGIYRLADSAAGKRARGHLEEVLQERFNTEVVQRRAKENGAELTASHRFYVKVEASAVEQLNLLGEHLAVALSDQLVQLGSIGDVALNGGQTVAAAVRITKGQNTVCLAVINALKADTAADGPVKR